MVARKVLVPLDSSPISIQTIKHLIALKETVSLPLTLFHVLDLGRLSTLGFPEVSYSQFEERARGEARKFLEDQQQLFAAAGIKTETRLKEGPARETICALADSGEFDLLVVGKNSDGDLRRLLFGQVADYVIHHTKCPVLIV